MIKRTKIKLTDSKTLVLETMLEERDGLQVILKATYQGRKARFMWPVLPGVTYKDMKDRLKYDSRLTPECYLSLILENEMEALRNLMPLLYGDTENLIPLIIEKVATQSKGTDNAKR